MNTKFKADYYRYTNKPFKMKALIAVFLSQNMSYILTGRMAANPNWGIFRKFWGGINKIQGRKMGNEISMKQIGAGLVLMHPYGITVNPGAVLGENVTLFKGATIGSVRGGSNGGVPTIGDRVTICCNAMVCGNITIGNDVLIASGAFVNFNVPDHSVVIGNPGKIHHKMNASKEYL